MLILIVLIASVVAGMALRRLAGSGHGVWSRVEALAGRLGQTATITVWLLIFVFGVSLGSNQEIVSDFPRFGLTAAIVAAAGVVGSVIASWIVGRLIDKRGKVDKGGRR